jgi:type II secretory pathway component HofQ
MLATQAKVNIVVPEYINGKLSVYLAKVPWDVAVNGILETHGLGFRYRPNGKVLRIAARKELDAEDAAQRERERQGR